MVKIKVYELIDPTTLSTRYIGITKNILKNRLSGHISKRNRGNTHKNAWKINKDI